MGSRDLLGERGEYRIGILRSFHQGDGGWLILKFGRYESAYNETQTENPLDGDMRGGSSGGRVRKKGGQSQY